jgi:hypothetical protein
MSTTDNEPHTPSHDHDHGDDAGDCPTPWLNLALTAGGSLVIGWLVGRSSYKTDMLRAFREAEPTPDGTRIQMPDRVW